MDEHDVSANEPACSAGPATAALQAQWTADGDGPTPSNLVHLHGLPAVAEEPFEEEASGRRPAQVDAWEAAYREHVTPVYRFIVSRTGNRPDAEDITAQVFLRALPRLRQDASAGQVRGYLLQTARTALAEYWTQRFGLPLEAFDESREPVRTPDAGPRHPAGDAPPTRGERRVASILALLPDNYRRVLELRFLSGLSVRETADGLGISVANAKVLQFRALRRAAQVGAQPGAEGAP